MFRGVSNLSLDAKGRLAMPSRYRDDLQSFCASRLVITIDSDRCLLLYPEPNWKEFERRLERLPTINPTVRKLQRLYVGHAHDTTMDAQGRIQLPPELRDFAGLEKRVVLLGQINTFELWDEDSFSSKRDVWLEDDDVAHMESSPVLQDLKI